MLESNKTFSNIRLKYISFLVACLCLTDAWSYGQRNAGIDFYQYWAVGQKISQAKKINVYSNNIRRSWGTEFLERANNSKSQRFLMAANYRKFLDTTASPFLYSLFGNLSPKDYDRAITIYRFICMVCVVFSFIMLGHLLRFLFVISMLFLVLFTLYFEPYRSDYAFFSLWTGIL